METLPKILSRTNNAVLLQPVKAKQTTHTHLPSHQIFERFVSIINKYHLYYLLRYYFRTYIVYSNRYSNWRITVTGAQHLIPWQTLKIWCRLVVYKIIVSQLISLVGRNKNATRVS